MWDRRALRVGKSVGVLVGHLEGLTHVSSKRDGRYLITNSKDQSIKVPSPPSRVIEVMAMTTTTTWVDLTIAVGSAEYEG